MEVHFDDQNLTIVMPRDLNLTPTKTGKSLNVASTRGFEWSGTMLNGRRLVVCLHAVIRK